MVQVVHNVVTELLLNCTRALGPAKLTISLQVSCYLLARSYLLVASLSVIFLSPNVNTAEQKAACKMFASFLDAMGII